MAYVVEVVPPRAGDDVFEVEAADYAEACVRARGFRERGMEASVAGSSDRPRWWRVFALGSGLPDLQVRARTAGCAIHQARRVSREYDGVQPAGVTDGD